MQPYELREKCAGCSSERRGPYATLLVSGTVVPTRFCPFMLINIVTTFLLLIHNQMSQGCLYNKSSISLHVGLGDWSPMAY